MQRNPRLQVRINLTREQTERWGDLLGILTNAFVISPVKFTDDKLLVKEFVLYPPKHVVDNVRWAERVAKFCCDNNLPALVVRM